LSIERTFGSFRNPKVPSTFSAQGEISSIRRVRAQVYAKGKTRKGKQSRLFTSLGEIVDAWASSETSGSLAFFEHLLLRVSGTFLAEALVTLGAATGSVGSAAVTGDIEGAVISSFGGSSSYL
jgi:hypothetical protein